MAPQNKSSNAPLLFVRHQVTHSAAQLCHHRCLTGDSSLGSDAELTHLCPLLIM